MGKRQMTYLRLQPEVKKKAKMAAAALGVSLSDYVSDAIINDCARLGIKGVEVEDHNQEEGR